MPRYKYLGLFIQTAFKLLMVLSLAHMNIIYRFSSFTKVKLAFFIVTLRCAAVYSFFFLLFA
jgi:hypothetical protein